MAKPILPTPPLTGKDVQDVLDQLESVATPEEMKRRLEDSQRWLDGVSKLKNMPIPDYIQALSPEPLEHTCWQSLYDPPTSERQCRACQAENRSS